MSIKDNREYWQQKDNMQYHSKQFIEPKRSTVKFADFLQENTEVNGSRIMDMACGGGANDLYLKSRFPDAKIIGMDINPELFLLAKKYREEHPQNNEIDIKRGGGSDIEFVEGDWYSPDEKWKDQFDGIISLQSLSWMEDWKKAIKSICELNPKWIAVSSLFYEGKIEYTIKLENHERLDEKGKYTQTNYNILSLPIVREYICQLGYTKFIYKPFEIDIDIPKPEGYDLGTYTVKTDLGKRMQISAALMMPWYFFYAEK